MSEGEFIPLTIPGCILCLEASDFNGGIWRDRSMGGNDMRAYNIAGYNGEYISFGNTGYFKSVNTASSLVGVFELTILCIFGFINGVGNTDAGVLELSADVNSNIRTFNVSFSNRNSLGFAFKTTSSYQIGRVTSSAIESNCLIQGDIRNYSGMMIRQGALLNNKDITFQYTDVDNRGLVENYLYVGSRAVTSRFFGGNMKRLIVYNRMLNADELNRLVNFAI